MEEVQDNTLGEEEKLQVLNQASLGEADALLDQDKSDNVSGVVEKKKKTAKELIDDQIEGFDDMIKFMDFSFERAF